MNVLEVMYHLPHSSPVCRQGGMGPVAPAADEDSREV